MSVRGENWRWNVRRHRAPSHQSMQVIDNPAEKPRRYPYGFAPPQPEAPAPPAPRRAKPSPEDGS